MTELIFLVEADPDGGLVARALGHSIFTQADGEAEVHAMVRDAVRCQCEDDEGARVIRLRYVRDEMIAA